ncbi:MAG: phosphatase PAP2 family protein [Xanthobacteraceae bacterium]
MKRIFDQIRQDRTTVKGHLHGIPVSGDGMGAFPSGHALHMGALASAAAVLPRRYKVPIWGVALGLSATRVTILAHWLSDVTAGFVTGIALERFIRWFTGCSDKEVRNLIANGRKT